VYYDSDDDESTTLLPLPTSSTQSTTMIPLLRAPPMLEPLQVAPHHQPQRIPAVLPTPPTATHSTNHQPTSCPSFSSRKPRIRSKRIKKKRQASYLPTRVTAVPPSPTVTQPGGGSSDSSGAYLVTETETASQASMIRQKLFDFSAGDCDDDLHNNISIYNTRQPFSIIPFHSRHLQYNNPKFALHIPFLSTLRCLQIEIQQCLQIGELLQTGETTQIKTSLRILQQKGSSRRKYYL